METSRDPIDLKAFQWTPDLSEEQLRRIRAVWNLTKTGTLESFEFGFTCDQHPDNEIAIWEKIANYTDKTIHHVPCLEHHRERLAYAYCMMLTCGGGAGILLKVMKDIPLKRFKTFKRFLFDAQKVGEGQ